MSNLRFYGSTVACVYGALTFVSLLLSTDLATQSRAQTTASLDTQDPVKSALERARLRDIYGVQQVLADYREEISDVYVLIFCDPDCPVVRQLMPTLRELHTHYNRFERDRTGTPIRLDEEGREVPYPYPGDRVQFIAVYSTPDLSVRQMAADLLEHRIPFRGLLDDRQEVLAAVGAERLSEVVVLDRDWKIRYQGAINDQFYPGGARPEATSFYLQNAIDALLEGKSIAVARRPTQGCRITHLQQTRDYPETFFYRDVLPILQSRCQSCHRDGEVGPMPLESYSDVYAYGEMLAEVVHDRRMPPWPADSPYRFKNDERLTSEELSTLLNWVRSGMAEGDPAESPPRKVWLPTNEWRIGQPDLVFEMPEPVKIPANGIMDYVYYPIKVSLPEDRFIQAVETIPGNPEVVHHIQVHEFTGEVAEGAGKLDLSPVEQLLLYGPSIEGTRLIGSYTPGNNDNAREYEPGAGMRLSRGVNLIFELHYTPNGRETSDRSRVGLRFTDQPPQREIETHFYFRKRGDFVIPSNLHNHSLQHLYHFERPVRILGIRTHFHLRGKSFRLEKVASQNVMLKDIQDFDQHEQIRGDVILTIPVWDFNWQRTYQFEEPLIVRRGEALLATGYFDNSRMNPRNPDWRSSVPWGQQTEHEMFNTLFIYEELSDEELVDIDSAVLTTRN